MTAPFFRWGATALYIKPYYVVRILLAFEHRFSMPVHFSLPLARSGSLWWTFNKRRVYAAVRLRAVPKRTAKFVITRLT